MKIRQLFFVLCLIVCGASVSPTAYASDAAEATEAAKDAINELLDDFDGFKDSEIFRRCVYGCGSENPGSEWRDKIRMSRPGSRMPSVSYGKWAERTPEAIPGKPPNCASALRAHWKSDGHKRTSLKRTP